MSIRSKTGQSFDLGADYIRGINDWIPSGLLSNLLWDLVQEAKIRTRVTVPTDVRVFYPDNYNSSNLQQWYLEYLAYVRNAVKTSLSNRSLRSYTETFVNRRNFTEQQRHTFYSMLYYEIESNEGAALDQIGAKVYFDVTSMHYGDQHVFHDTGFGSVIDYLAKSAGPIRLAQIVTKITYGEEDIEVRTTDGLVYRANYVLLTVPLGVLKSRSIEFAPQLPQWKWDAIDRLGFGTLDKIVLIWDRAWWNIKDYYFLPVSAKPAEFGYWVNANKWNDKPALVCHFKGDEAHRLETNLTKDQVIEQLLRNLQQMFPNRTIPRPVDSYMTYWKQDPFSNGSYVYVSVQQTHADPSYLAEPIGNRLLFAGEATHTDAYGYADGALMSARREATRLLFVYDLLPKRKANDASTMNSSRIVQFLVVFVALQRMTY